LCLAAFSRLFVTRILQTLIDLGSIFVGEAAALGEVTGSTEGLRVVEIVGSALGFGSYMVHGQEDLFAGSIESVEVEMRLSAAFEDLKGEEGSDQTALGADYALLCKTLHAQAGQLDL